MSQSRELQATDWRVTEPPGQLVGISHHYAPADPDPVPCDRPDPAPLLIIGALVAAITLVGLSLWLPSVTSAKVQNQAAQIQAQRAELSRIKQCIQ